ncbi:laminin subunit alpha-like isoform X2 [Biomphalaria glabrata]|uniref:Laminin subunit alpha-like isoform X2 n=1 Tax=Biomphalaria glabrata TaxID=6526 RepID=A0A9W3AB63_BIOGL|nr:laminin subunit alpha-like isoform X2 [Biomphalaria glabrata]
MATGTSGPVCLLCFIILCLPTLTFAAVFTPPYFNLAQGRNITATATCGYGVPYRELYCSIASNAGQSRNREPITGELIQGQYCDYCDSNNPDKDHRVENAIDGSERWWQSPPLSRLGAELNKVNVTINLGQEFHVAYVYIMMANSPRPGVWVLERSIDFGKTWQPWQYFADTPSDCLNFFNTSADEPLTRDTQIRCTTEFSKIVPLSNGEIVVSLVNGRPNAHNFSYADDLQEWTRATDIQLRLLRTKTLHAHLMAKVREDPTVTRRYYYSIKDISIGGRCVCNGHAVSCDVRDPDTNRLLCGCIHNTCGAQCDRCCPGFTQKKWRRALVDQPFQCEPCECFGHTAECIYDENVDRNRQSLDIYGKYEGGGVCQNCRDNTMGVNCEKCVSGYYRPYDVPRNATDACRPCECDLKVSTGECEEGSGRCLCRPEYTGELCDRCSFGYYGYPDCIPCECDVKGTEGSICTTNSGICPCKYNFAGSKCNQCAQGYYNFPECKPCGCNLVGSPSSVCDLESGQCQCLGNFAGRDCSECANGYFRFPTCEYCDCDHSGTTSDICDKSSGQCLCRERYTDERCNRCAPGFYRFPECLACQCESPGSRSKICFETTGQCRCNPNFAGQNCDRCAAGYYKYPECIPCNCNLYGSLGQTCDQTSGQCNCRSNFVGVMCDKCGENFYNYPNCEVCNCNPDGAKEILGFPLGGCGIRTSGLLCECKDKVMGRICDKCKPGYWNLNRKNPEGCETCSCHEPGTLAGVNKCDMKTGQCECKPRVTGRDCNTCLDGFYNLQERNPFGCVDCECDRGGSLRPMCDKVTGKCACKPRITGQKCDKAVTGHYVPTLQQYKFEVEDGKTPEGARIRYGYDLREFPNFSWRGYAVLTSVQPEVRFDVDIRHSSLYQVIYRYVNPTNSTVKGTVTFTPDSPTENVQTGLISLSPTMDPKFVTVTSETSQSFVLNPGLWTISTNTPGYVFLDYFVLVPNAYYEASQVQHKVTNPCVAPNDPGPCVHFKYPDLEGHPKGLGKSGYKVLDDNTRVDVVLNPDDTLNNLLGSQGLVEINERQRSFIMDLYVPLPNEYLIFINYYNPGSSSQQLDVEVELPGGNKKSVVTLANCPFTTLCRQVLREPEGWEALFNITTGRATLYINSRGDGKDVDLYIDSVYAIPKAQYHHDLIMPKTICVEVNGNCVPSVYGTPVGAQRIDFENTPNEDLVSKSPPPDILDSNIGLVNLEDTIKLVDQTSCPISEDNKTDQCETETVTSVRPLELYGQVPKPGQYVFIVHYYMPKEAGLAIPVSVFADGVESTGIFSPRFCPNIVGCRATIRFDISGGNVVRLTGTDIKAVFNGTRVGQIWLDYMLIVPVDQYNPDFLDVLPVDKSAEFLKKCVDDGFQLKEGDKFCQEGAFTLTTNFNNGALDCNCNSEGSRSFTCDTFGGFCQCKDNIIGRTCSACRPGYYGFPNCRPCNCPFGVCQADTGECVCPPFVEGQSCDRCKPEAYGYDRLIGCQQCSCHPEGVLSRDLNCDQVTGQCRCKPHVGGRRCNTCMAGFYSFPHCEDCGCDVRGTLPGICDLRTSQCFCKENVEGAQCDKCIDGTFSLSSEHPKGCTKCFCFGHTTRCESTTLSWYGITSMSGWKLSNNKNVDVEPDTVSVRNVKDGIDDGESVYWVAPADYLGKKINSYGGKLQYSVYNDVSEGRQVYALGHHDVIITGNNMTIVHTLKTQPAPKVKTEVELQLVQYNFQHEGTQNRVSREQFMMILINIESILIRATYYSDVDLASLSNVRMEIATVNGFGEVAKTVEECNCPPNYRGASCEDCAPGYYRARTTPYLGICLKCNCNGHSDSCDVVTGECYNCQNNTTGPHCEKCIAGYFGDPETGPCRICPCPLEIPSNNFASTCNYNESQGTLQCSCFPGYSGSRCQSCDSGYYGNPREIGGFCQPCNCSGNIDMTNPRSCDRFTGDCLICERHTAGSRCEYCQDWYWGDAIIQKNCQQCSCNRCGSVSCYKENGFCQCKPNVVGQDCDRCAQNTWGFDFCSGGCRDCECGAGAVTQQCDLNTGICLCQPGVEGEKCDRCKHGHWNLGASGCEACQCEFDGATGCDPDTGRCMCLPGVTGERCDRCLPRWILVPNRGCQECDYCVHLLIDDLDTHYMNVNVVRRQLHEVSVGVGAFNRLSNYQDQVSDLRPLVDQLNTRESDDFGEKLKSLKALLDNHSIEVRKYHSQSVGVSSDAANIETQISELNAKTNDATDAAKNVTLLGQETLQFIQLVDQKLMDSSDSVIIDALLTESNMIAQEIENLDFSVRKLNSNEEKENATEDVSRALLLRDSSMKNFNYSNQLIQDIAKLESRLNDLLNNTQGSTESTEAAQGIIRRLRAVHVENLMMSHQIISSLSKEREILIEDSEKITSLGSESYNKSQADIETIEVDSSRLEDAIPKLQAKIDELDANSEELVKLYNQSRIRADYLQMLAADLDSMYDDTRNISQNSVIAGQSYKVISSSIDEANQSTEQVLSDLENTKNELTALETGAAEAIRKSDVQDTEARSLDRDTKSKYVDQLSNAENNIKEAEEDLEKVSNSLENVNSNIDRLKETKVSEISKRVVDGVANANEAVTLALDQSERARRESAENVAKMEYIVNNRHRATESLRDTENDVQSAENNLPMIISLLNNSSQRVNQLLPLGDGISESVGQLREKIARARDEANRLKLGLHFLGNTSLTLRNPAKLDDTGSYTRVSVYIKTSQPEALLVYVGDNLLMRSEDGRIKRQVADDVQKDYLALEIRDSKVVFTFNLGSGSAKLVSKTMVNNGKWHHIIAERIGKSGKLTIQSTGANGDDIVEGSSPGTSSVLELSTHKSIFLVGGVPEIAEVPLELTTEPFNGGMEDLKFDDEPVGLWNFVEAKNNKVGYPQRDFMQEIFTEGVYFNGQGYAALSRNDFQIRGERTQVSFQFKTYAADGLLFYIGLKDYFSLELAGGHLLFRFDLGKGAAVARSNDVYNNGSWTSVNLDRNSKIGIMSINNGVEDIRVESKGNLKTLEIGEDIYIGGIDNAVVPPREMTTTSFEGCLKNFNLGTLNLNPMKNKRSKGLIKGCVEKIARIVTFPASKSGYIALKPVSIGSMFDVTFKIKTKEINGLLLFASDLSQSNVFAVVMSEGQIKVVETANNEESQLASLPFTYNDGKWHYISIMKMGRELSMSIDDTNVVNYSTGPEQIDLDTAIYLGGLPSSVTATSVLVSDMPGFLGCIGDITINKKFQNLANLKESKGISLTDCPVERADLTPVRTCALPATRSDNRTIDSTAGTRYGLTISSRSEYLNLGPKLRLGPNTIIATFRTSAPDGVIFYTSDKKHVDHLTIFMLKGKVFFGFDFGSGPASMSSTETYNDNEWHIVKVVRRGKEGSLFIDGKFIIKGSSEKTLKTLNVIDPSFVGGLPENEIRNALRNLKNVSYTGFLGCIKDLILDNKPFPNPARNVNTTDCSSFDESGAFFGINGGYLIPADRFKVHTNMDIQLEIRPRTQEGVLLSVHNKTDYVVLQMTGGDIVFTVDNGAGPITARYKASFKFYLCDGNWHSINAVKRGNNLTLTVDGKSIMQQGSKSTSVAADTNDPLYIGGLTDMSAKGVLATGNYSGCIRNVYINRQFYSLYVTANGDVRNDACQLD